MDEKYFNADMSGSELDKV